MPDIARVMREEISRIARKEAKAAVTPIQRRTVKLERAAAEFRKRLALLEKEARQLNVMLKKVGEVQPATPVPEDQAKGAWFTARGIKGIRGRLGISQAKLARLVGVTTNAAASWEKKAGLLKFRDGTKAALLALRNIGKEEAKRRLAKSGKRK